MNWPVILSMILILIVGIITYRLGKPTESVVITLILLMIFYIVYGHYYYSTVSGFEVQVTPEKENRLETNSTGTGLPTGIPTDLPTGLPTDTGTSTGGNNQSNEEIKLTFKQKTAKMIAEYMDNKTKREWMMRIMTRIQDTKPNMQNPENNLPQIMYNASLPEKKIFDEVIEENDITGMTFDEFFIAMVEILIESNKNPRNLGYAFATKFEPLFQAWRVKHLAATAAETEKATETTKAEETTKAKKSVPESSPAPVSELAKLLEVLKPATATIINPTASASEIGTVVNTSPGLQQGQQYNTVAISRTFPTPGPRCPQPSPQSHCACQKPIMPDGKPFDPNMYIRKDSIPCWNCQLPI